MSFSVLAWLVLGLNLILVVLVLLRPWRRLGVHPGACAAPASGRENTLPLRLLDLVFAVVVAGILLVIEVVAVLRPNPFGVVRLVYLHSVVLAPVLGLLVVTLKALPKAARPFAVSRPAAVLAVLAVCLAPVGLYASFVEPFDLKLEAARVPLRTGRDPGGETRVAVLADIQTDGIGNHERRAINLAMSQQPDIILLPGDLWQSDRSPTPEDVVASRELLGLLSAPGGVWFVPGNCDSPAWVEKLLTGTPVVMLDSAITQTRVKGRQVTIGAVVLAHNDNDRAATLVKELENAPGDGDIRILLTHYPDAAAYLKTNSRIDLVVAGHTHGGQIVIPGYGPLVTFSHAPRSMGGGGLHRLNGNPLYVSRGVGCERGQAPRIRLFCPPEVSLLTLSGS